MCSTGLKALVAPMLVVTLAGCSGKKTAAARAAAEILDDAVSPKSFAAELRKLGGGHVHATITFHVDRAGGGGGEAGSAPASPPSVTTTTDLWMDRNGDFRLLESNDQDGGREIVKVGGALAVALRYGKMIRRAAEDAESARYLSEALGGPWSAWEIVRRQIELEGGAGELRLRLSARKENLPARFAPAEGVRKWRDSVTVKTLEGKATLEAGDKVLREFGCKTSFDATRDGVPIEGDIAVSMTVDQVGQVAALVLPASEPLRTRQRTVPEEKALLGGIAASAGSALRKSSP